MLRSVARRNIHTRGDTSAGRRNEARLTTYTHPISRNPKRRIGPSTKPPKRVYAKELTEGRKLGPVSATYVSQASCPSACAFRGAGCYAEHGPLAMVTTKRLNNATHGETPEDLSREEAAAIDGLTGTRPLRLHVVGDCATDEAAQIVAAASARYTTRGGGLVWTYTHAWRTVERVSWGDVSVLASCETDADVALARDRGYATARTVLAHEGAKRAGGVLPCPEQTRGVQCADCRLCLDDGRLREKAITISFALHGDKAAISRARHALEGVA